MRGTKRRTRKDRHSLVMPGYSDTATVGVLGGATLTSQEHRTKRLEGPTVSRHLCDLNTALLEESEMCTVPLPVISASIVAPGNRRFSSNSSSYLILVYCDFFLIQEDELVTLVLL